MKDSNVDKLLAPNDVAELLMVSPTTVRFWAQKGALKALTTPGGHRRFEMKEVEAFAVARGMRLRNDNDTLRILFIDDDVAFSNYLVDLFDNIDGVETELANHSFEAGLKARSFKPHVILMDIMMPELDGFQVCQQIKSDPLMKDIRVIAMTGFASTENVQKILNVGAEACLKKPLDTNELFSLLGLNGVEAAAS